MFARSFVALFLSVLGVTVGSERVCADLLEFEATLNSDQAIGCLGESSTGFGSGSFILDTDTGQVDYFIEFFDLSSPETAAHIHGPAGRDCEFADILVILPGGSPKEGFYIFGESDVADMIAGRHFVLIHSQMWPQGEIRGQILALNTEQDFVRGDVDADGVVNALVDGISLLGFGFAGGPAPTCQDAADVNNDGSVNALVDTIALLAFGFSGGAPPQSPFPGCGADTAVDEVTCVFYGACP